MRGEIFFFHQRNRKKHLEEDAKVIKELKLYQRSGWGLTILPIFISLSILQMILGNDHINHSGITIYFASKYALFKIVAPIVNLIKARKDDDMTVRAFRSISFADALMATMSLDRLN